jgi:hypothetical protein
MRPRGGFNARPAKPVELLIGIASDAVGEHRFVDVVDSK